MFSLVPSTQEVSIFIFIGLLTAGFVIMLGTTNDLPLFYEFDWRDNLLKLFVIDQKHRQFLYAKDFTRHFAGKNPSPGIKRDQMRDDLFTGAIDGIETMISTITSSTDRRLYEISQGNSMILLEYGDKFSVPIIYALVVKKKLSSFRHLLQRGQGQFEASFGEILHGLDRLSSQGPESQFFESFDIIVNNLMNA